MMNMQRFLKKISPWLCLLLPMILLCSYAGAYQKKPFQIRAVYQNKYPNMRAVSSFSADLAKKYDNLDSKQFQVSENDQTLNIQNFIPPRVIKEGSATVFLIDQSRSVLNKMDQQKTVLKNYLNQMDWNDEIAIVGFDDDVVYYTLDASNQAIFFSDRLQIVQAINQIQVRPDRDLITYRSKALEEGLILLGKSTRKNRNIVMITDDNDDNTNQRLRALDHLYDSKIVDQIETRVKNDQIKVYAMIMQDTEEWRRNTDINKILRRLSIQSGGEIYENLHDENDLNRSLQDASVLTFPDMDIEAYASYFLIHQDEKTTTEASLSQVKTGLLDHLKYLHSKDQMAIVKTGEAFASSNDPALMKEKIEKDLSIRSKDQVFPGLRKAQESLGRLPIDRKYLVVVMPENHSRLKTPQDADEILETYKQSGISVYLISKGKINQAFLNKLSKETLGQVIQLPPQSTYEDGIAQFYDWLYHSYNLEYVSQLNKADNFLKPVKLKVVVSTKDKEYEDTFTYILGSIGFQLPKTPLIFWLLLAFLLIAILAIALLFASNEQKKKRIGSSSVTQCKYCRMEIPAESLSCPHCGKPQYENFDEQSNDQDTQDPTMALQGTEKTRVVRKTKPSLAWLVLINSVDKGQSFDLLEKEKTNIGRDTTNQIVLADDSISKMHAIVFTIDKDYFIQDCASQNQTILNGKAVDRAQLKDNDTIQLGETQLIFKQVKISRRKGA